MVGKDGSVRTVEFNCRLGDPEAQPILMRLKSDLFSLLDHAVRGRLEHVAATWDRRVALGTVLAFMMSVIALSLPEMIILRKVLKLRLIATFVGVVAAGILIVGYVFNLAL